MLFHSHSNLEGKHAFLSPSSPYWLRYDDEKMTQRYNSWHATEYGTRLHEFAKNAINLGITLSNSKDTLSLYVNDCIRYKMSPEVLLYYSDNCFGTADAIAYYYNNEKNKYTLRIHDLKTGVTKAHMEQLMIYAALFCLEYDVDPKTIDIILVIYKDNKKDRCYPTGDDILNIMELIELKDEFINRRLKAEGY